MRKRRQFFKPKTRGKKRRNAEGRPGEPSASLVNPTKLADPEKLECSDGVSEESEDEPDCLSELVRSVTGKESVDWKDEFESDDSDESAMSESDRDDAVDASGANLGSSSGVVENEDVEDLSDDYGNDGKIDGGLKESGNEENTYSCELDDEEADDESHLIAGVEEEDAPDDPFTLHFEKDLTDSDLDLSKQPTKWTKVLRLNGGPLGQLAYKRCDFPGSATVPCLAPVDRIFERGRVSVSEADVLEHVRNALRLHLPGANSLHSDPDSSSRVLTDYQRFALAAVGSYADVLLTERNFDSAEELRVVYCLHALNHALKTRTRVVRHNRRLYAKREREKAAAAERRAKGKKRTATAPVEEDIEYRDQGFVRPKVLILLPFRDAALKVGNLLISLIAGDSRKPANVVNRKKFVERFGWEEKDSSRLAEIKPADYAATFSGNIDDAFLFGISVTKKSLKFFADLYSSDIIIASPMGLRVKIGGEGERDRDMDFLASIEVLIMDQADVFLMQNWSHVLHIFDHLHLTPSENRGTDFSRIRMWSLSGHAASYRQTLIFSSTPAVEISSLFNKKCRNVAGKFSSANPVVDGSICLVTIPLPQTFRYFTASNPVDDSKERFQLFVEKVLPRFKDVVTKNVMIFIPSYFDFITLRNYFKKEELEFAEICEYTEDKKIRTARNRFFRGYRKFLLFTERFHFFRRYKIKGIRHIVFYGLPLYSHFYPEMINYMQGRMTERWRTTDMSCTVIFSQVDAIKLAGVVGTQKAASMLQERKESYFLVTE